MDIIKDIMTKKQRNNSLIEHIKTLIATKMEQQTQLDNDIHDLCKKLEELENVR